MWNVSLKRLQEVPVLGRIIFKIMCFFDPMKAYLDADGVNMNTELTEDDNEFRSILDQCNEYGADKIFVVSDPQRTTIGHVENNDLAPRHNIIPDENVIIDMDRYTGPRFLDWALEKEGVVIFHQNRGGVRRCVMDAT